MRDLKIEILRKFKYLLLRFRLHHLIPSNLLTFAGQAAMLSQWVNSQKNLGLTDFPNLKYDFDKRYNLYTFVINNEVGEEPIDYFEFGVSTGESFRWWIQNLKNPDSRFYGFDTFTGLPEDWGPFKKGEMSAGNKPPEINDTRHQFFQGVFQDTFPKFLSTYQSKRKKVILLDADLYSSTLFVLTSFSPYLNPGDVILFDEFNVPRHEFKAFSEWSNSFYINYEVLGEVNNFYQVAIKLK